MERESRILEYKRHVNDFAALAKTAIAFANGDGGKIVVGVDDKTRMPMGLSPIDIDSLLEKLPVSLADRILPPLFPQVFERTIDGKEVLIVQVFPGNQKPYFMVSEGMEKGVYVRIGSHTRRATGEILEELRLLRSRIGYDEQLLRECNEKEMDTASLPKSLRTPKGLLSLEILAVDPFTGASHPTRGGVLMFHPHPHSFVPEAVLICSKMRGDTGRDTIESHEFVGSLPDQLDKTISLLQEWLARDPKVKGSRYSATSSALPMDAVREACSNALFHRQYSIPGATKVALYADRLEIFSPGHFAGPFIPESLGDGTSYIRNRVIALAARRLELIEKRGTGLRLIIDTMRDRNQSVEFIEGPGWFKTIMHLGATGGRSTSDYSSAVMELFEVRSEITNAEVCRHISVSKATGAAVLKGLIQDERIKRVGRGPRTRYVVTGR